MATYFMDLVNNELCIMNANDMFNPFLYNFTYHYYLPENAIFYVLESKLKTLRHHFPQLRLQAYNITELPQVPANISCPWSYHGNQCAYKQCLSMCVDYCRAY